MSNNVSRRNLDFRGAHYQNVSLAVTPQAHYTSLMAKILTVKIIYGSAISLIHGIGHTTQ